jgi:hypothetical protein
MDWIEVMLVFNFVSNLLAFLIPYYIQSLSLRLSDEKLDDRILFTAKKTRFLKILGF